MTTPAADERMQKDGREEAERIGFDGRAGAVRHARVKRPRVPVGQAQRRGGIAVRPGCAQQVAASRQGTHGAHNAGRGTSKVHVQGGVGAPGGEATG